MKSVQCAVLYPSVDVCLFMRPMCTEKKWCTMSMCAHRAQRHSHVFVAYTSQNMSQHYLTFSIDMWGPHRQCRFLHHLSDPASAPRSGVGMEEKANPQGLSDPTPAAWILIFALKLPFHFRAAVDQKPQMGSVEKDVGEVRWDLKVVLFSIIRKKIFIYPILGNVFIFKCDGNF